MVILFAPLQAQQSWSIGTRKVTVTQIYCHPTAICGLNNITIEKIVGLLCWLICNIFHCERLLKIAHILLILTVLCVL